MAICCDLFSSTKAKLGAVEKVYNLISIIAPNASLRLTQDHLKMIFKSHVCINYFASICFKNTFSFKAIAIAITFPKVINIRCFTYPTCLAQLCIIFFALNASWRVARLLGGNIPAYQQVTYGFVWNHMFKHFFAFNITLTIMATKVFFDTIAVTPA